MSNDDNKHVWETGWVMMRWSERDPSFAGVNVVGQTEKAVRLQAETSKLSAWFPKSAFKQDKYGAYLPAAWLRNKMTHREMKALGYAA